MGVIRFILAVALYFTATDLLEDFFNIAEGTNTWLAMEIFSGVIEITAVFFISKEATGLISLYLLYSVGSTFWNNEGFFNILFLCAGSLVQMITVTILIDQYEKITGKTYYSDN